MSKTSNILIIKPTQSGNESISLHEFVSILLDYAKRGLIIELRPAKDDNYLCFYVDLKLGTATDFKGLIKKTRLAKFKMAHMINFNELEFVRNEVQTVFKKENIKPPVVSDVVYGTNYRSYHWCYKECSKRKIQTIKSIVDKGAEDRATEEIRTQYSNITDRLEEVDQIERTILNLKQETLNIKRRTQNAVYEEKRNGYDEGVRRGERDSHVFGMLRYMKDAMCEYYNVPEHMVYSVPIYPTYSEDYPALKNKDGWHFQTVKLIEAMVKSVKYFENKQKAINKETKNRIKKKRGLDEPKTYLIKDKRNGLYKIGKSIKPPVRERTLQSEKPDYEMVKVWEKNIESKLHKKYSDQRVRGEWFKLSRVQVEYMCRSA